MPKTITKLSSDGTFFTAGIFDEVTFAYNTLAVDTTYSSLFDEINKPTTTLTGTLSSNLVAAYNFDGTISNSLTGYSLSPGTACVYNYTTSNNGTSAIQFTNLGSCGNSSGLYCGTNPWDLYDGATDASYSFWINFSQNLSYTFGCAYGFFGNMFGRFGFYGLIRANNQMAFGISNSYEYAGPAYTTGLWYHVVGTFKASTKTFNVYINGVLTNSVSNITLNAPGQNYIGFGVNGSAWEYGIPCTFESVNLWNRTLSQSEVTYLYNNGTALQYPSFLFASVAKRDTAPLTWSTITSAVTSSISNLVGVYGDNKFVVVGQATGGTTTASYSLDGINWTNTTLPFKQQWNSVAYGKGVFVTVGNPGILNITTNAAYSYDGITWSASTMPRSKIWSSVCFGANKFIAVAKGNPTTYYAASSNDGINWGTIDLITGPGFSWTSICYGIDKFVAVGQTQSFGYSTDGITWNYTTGSSTNERFNSVTYGNSVFVSVALGDSSGSATNISIYSNDGITWYKTILPVSDLWNNVTYANGNFIAVGANNVLYSTDGICWQKAYTPNIANTYSACYGNNVALILTTNRSLLYSNYASDGIDWYQYNFPVPSYTWRSFAYGNGKFVLIAANSNVALYSTNGTDWVQSSLPSSQTWYRVAYGNGTYVAVTYGSNVAAYSTDGINWTQISLPASANWTAITYGKGKFIAFADNLSSAIYSSDGINWSTTSLPINESWSGVAFGNNTYVAVGDYSSGRGVYSSDGITWTAFNQPSAQSWTSITYGGGKFVTCSREGISAYSTDGVNWTKTNLPSTGIWSIITYGNGRFVTVLYPSSLGAYSTDGINWVPFNLPYSDYRSSLIYGDGKFITTAANSNKFTYGKELPTTIGGKLQVKNYFDEVTFREVNWKKSIVPAYAGYNSIAYGNSRYVALNYSNSAINSFDGINWSTSILPVTATWQGLTYGNNIFVAFANNSNFGANTTDGINWNTFYLPTTASWGTCGFGAGKFVALPYVSFNGAYSTDGTNWTTLSTGLAGFSPTWSDLKYLNGQFVGTVGNGNTVIYSPDGFTWSKTTLPIANQGPGTLAYGNGVYICTNVYSLSYCYSYDAITWYPATLPSDFILNTPPSYTFQTVTFCKDVFVIIDSGQKLYGTSVDGINWKVAETSFTLSSNRLVYANGKIVGVYYGGGEYSYY